MKEDILAKLAYIEEKENIKILYAVESGSRAWGFPSQNSDYDVRFIYKRPKEFYLKLEKTKDTLDYPITDLLDFSGWDLDKTLRLLQKSNPSLMEWLYSPIVYAKNEAFYQAFTELAHGYMQPKVLLYHYLHMANGNFREYLQGETVKIKKYFYVLRPVFACMWLEKYEALPPLDFQEMWQGLALAPDLIQAITALYQRKIAGEEMDLEPASPLIHDFISNQLAYYKEYVQTVAIEPTAGYERLNAFFLEWIAPTK